jgi:hypothetical protein
MFVATPTRTRWNAGALYAPNCAGTLLASALTNPEISILDGLVGENSKDVVDFRGLRSASCGASFPDTLGTHL